MNEHDKAIYELLHDDGHLDDMTVRLCRTVIERASEGHTTQQLQGYMAYRRRIAEGEDRVRVQRVRKALSTNRWGLLDVVQRARTEARQRLRGERDGRAARQAFYDQIAAVNATIPPNKRGRGSGGRRRGRKDDRRTTQKHVPGTLV